ncbi:MAG: hypothetical protein CVV49_04020 [Spirochaetae bacterium HGW-Spirochaetae-5]|nr:MAG: hypothetical protein CVV49_04020 [Spirochaetae bacterium HGW-Spirochaetae-5]
MKNKLFLIILLLNLTGAIYAAPLAGVSGISSNTERASTLALVLEKHILEILKNNSFSVIQPEVINRELTKFSCIEEKCILKFADDADINLIVSGTVTDYKKSIVIKLQAYGIKIPFNQRVINSYEVKIPMDVSISSREFSLISEEHAAEFLAKTLSIFQIPVKIRKEESRLILSDNYKTTGRYTVYSSDKNNFIQSTGETEINEGVLSPLTINIEDNQYFILIDFRNESKAIKGFYRTRKNEIVFSQTSFYDTLFILAIIPAASASMPVSSPILGYYMNEDWEGLGLWMLSAPPYLYMEARGFLNSPENLKKKNKDITRDDRAMNYFAWYMLLAGGMPLFVDSYNYNYLHQVSYFKENNELLGNTATAALLSLTSNGAGHFYRGDRQWGYFYFHLNNILLYMTIREFSTPEYYDDASQSYKKGESNKNRGIIFGSILALSKSVEIIHAILQKENLSTGEVTDEYIIPSPLFTLDERGNPVYGVSVTYKF